MGLDVYVGSLTRYYSGDWETVVAKAAREQGMGFKIIRSKPEPPDKISDPAAVFKIVDAWLNSLEIGLGSALPGGLSWDERAQADYFTDKPDWVGYAGLVLLAAHTALPEYPQPNEKSAQFGLALFLHHAQLSVEHQLPMKLDY